MATYELSAEARYRLMHDAQERVNKEKAAIADPINPDHYKVGGIECWDVFVKTHSPTQVAGAALFVIKKYLWRVNHKNQLEDLKKAKWYLDKLIEEIDGKDKADQSKYFT